MGVFGKSVDNAAIKAQEKNNARKEKKAEKKEDRIVKQVDTMMNVPQTMSGRKAAKLAKQANQRLR
ncbi:hypothetical protein ACIA49_10300 [Kribbella sp. NPDC051587]|uniref:hypothetical protein n=1 Tax=Kribbella sp. NPDC051587 TaxID=3364119 RepID=UPI0037B849F5